MSQPSSESEIRERIAAQIRANPEIGVVHSRGRGAINIETMIPLLRNPTTGLVKGCVVRPIGFTQQDSPDKVNFIEKTLRYGLLFGLTFNDEFSETTTSTDYFSDEMIERTDMLLREYRALGYDKSIIEHQLLQFPQDWAVTPSERSGKYHLGLGLLQVKWLILANQCD